MLCIAEELSEKLNAVGIKAEYIAEDKDNYTDELVNFTHPKDNGDSLAVMKDFGVTWSPSCTTTTPRFCDVDVNDIDSAALELKMVATAWRSTCGSESKRIGS
jgi:hypothetical protein